MVVFLCKENVEISLKHKFITEGRIDKNILIFDFFIGDYVLLSHVIVHMTLYTFFFLVFALIITADKYLFFDMQLVSLFKKIHETIQCALATSIENCYK